MPAAAPFLGREMAVAILLHNGRAWVGKDRERVGCIKQKVESKAKEGCSVTCLRQLACLVIIVHSQIGIPVHNVFSGLVPMLNSTQAAQEVRLGRYLYS